MIAKAIIIFVLIAASSFAADIEIWNQANSNYDQGRYTEAIDGYRTFLERGYRFPEVYFNLGNAYFKDNKIGPAIASFRHSLKLAPSFTPAKENLDYARTFTVDRVEPKPRGFLLDLWYGLVDLISPSGYFILSIILYWILCAIGVFLINGYGRRELTVYILIFTSIAFITSVTITRFAVNHERNTRWGVVVAQSVDLREGPGDEFGKIFTGHEGLEIKIISARQKYILIELENGLKGWIPGESLTEI